MLLSTTNYWQETDRKIVRKINQLLRNCQRTPFERIGKPEPLKGEFRGFWSRRNTQKHSLVYEVADNNVFVTSCCYHYEK